MQEPKKEPAPEKMDTDAPAPEADNSAPAQNGDEARAEEAAFEGADAQQQEGVEEMKE